MNRRTVIKNIVIVSAAGSLLPSCLHSDAKPASAFKKINISSKQEEMLAQFSQTVIPTTDTPGAKEQRSHEFALTMVDDCFSPEEQQKFMGGLKAFEEYSQKKYSGSFSSLDNKLKKQLLSELETKKDAPKDVIGFYKIMRGLTLQGYTGSEYFMTNVGKYNIIPKHYKGCVHV